MLDELLSIREFYYITQHLTSLHFELGGQVVQVPVERKGENSTQSHSPETGLDPDEWELQEGNEEQCSCQVAHSCESFALAEYKYGVTVLLQRGIRYFLI